ncbi:MAG: efflux RND transporter periplasmic adaptor subunit [Euryhalocaulis sp.]|uniref:efflux RND transporter periplasmic adaptor subunit n=1 Tax=Euryhalocaulis sp. TaxID=2744307 RepID=UPI0017998FF6|nr:efflux RND transporter periplasmic adaptor subunit [Euryhalocaulis sp.]MBA4802614.1 efflux RND transporter periplasmic adaptor subunit [Euryhalocaulis sp.]
MLRPLIKFAVLGLSAALLAACGEGASENAQQGPGAPEVSTATPLVERVVDWDAYAGRFESPESVNIRARVNGYLEEVHFQDGQHVEKGDLLFTIDQRPYQAAVESARGEVNRARATLEQARQALTRADELRAAEAVSEQDLENARAAAQQADANLSAAQANLRSQQLNLDFTKITAPISGRISDRRVDPGNLVSAGTDTLTTIVSIDPIHFVFDVSESALLNYQRQNRSVEGAEVEIRLQGDNEFRWEGNVTFADNSVDSSTGTIRLKAEIPNADGFLRPGLYGDGRMQGTAPYDAILVPQTAILSDATRRLVYVVGEENKVEARAVELGPLSGDLRVIKSGLSANDRVVINGLQRAMPGAPVTPTDGEISRTAETAMPGDPAQGGGSPAAAAIPVE